jgi:hypothetical protein
MCRSEVSVASTPEGAAGATCTDTDLLCVLLFVDEQDVSFLSFAVSTAL